MQFLTNQVRLRNRLHCTTGPQPADIFGGQDDCNWFCA